MSQTQQPEMPALTEKQDVIEQLTETGVSEPVADSVADLLAQDYAIAKIKEHDREYARLIAENIVTYVRCQHPPQGSMVQGPLRMALTGDMTDGTTALSDKQQTQLKSTLLAMFFRTSRSVGGWQQDKFSEQIQTRRVEDERGDDDGGIAGGLFS